MHSMLPWNSASQGATNQMPPGFSDLGPSRWITVWATVICWPLAAAFSLLGCGLVLYALCSLLGMFFVGHLEATAILLLLGLVSFVLAAILCAVPIVLISRRREAASFIESRPKNDR